MKQNRLSPVGSMELLRKVVRQITLVGILVIAALGSPFAPHVAAYDPHFRLPWASGATYLISGSQYDEGFHTGNDYYAIDFGLPTGHEVRAAQGGYATFAYGSACGTYGNYVVVNHGNGFSTLYAHLQDFSIANGTNVVQGQLLGHSGSSGTCPAQPHLHFAPRVNGGKYMAEPMSGYTGFGNPANFNSTPYTNGPLLSNVIRNGDAWSYPIMNDNGGGPWQRSAYSNYNVVCCGPDGNNYLEMNTGVFGSASVWQDFPAYDTDWSNYTATSTFVNVPDTWTLRARIRSTCGFAQGTIAIWALNGPAQEAGSTPFVANGNWQTFIATTRFASNGHNRLRPIIYMDTANCNYDFDNVTLQRNYINNSSFESGFNYWVQRFPGNCVSYYGVYANSGAQDNSAYLEINRGTCPGTGTDVSFYQDVGAYTQQGDKFYFRLRARRNASTSGWINMHAWALGTTNSTIIDQWVSIPGDYAWRELEASGVVPQSGNTSMRVEIYLNDPDNYDFDGLQIYGGAGEP